MVSIDEFWLCREDHYITKVELNLYLTESHITVRAGCRSVISVSHFQKDFCNQDGNRKYLLVFQFLSVLLLVRKYPQKSVDGYKAPAINMKNSPYNRMLFANSAQLHMHSIHIPWCSRPCIPLQSTRSIPVKTVNQLALQVCTLHLIVICRRQANNFFHRQCQGKPYFLYSVPIYTIITILVQFKNL